MMYTKDEFMEFDRGDRSHRLNRLLRETLPSGNRIHELSLLHSRNRKTMQTRFLKDLLSS